MLNFVLSRRKYYQANRYWDTVTGFPKGLSPMPNLVLLDADSGRFYRHHLPFQGFQWGAVTMMRAFELHFARSALSAMKKATAESLGGNLFEEYFYVSRRCKS